MSTPKPENSPSRGQWRVWLKGAVESNQLDRVPPRYDGGPGGSCDTRDYAEGLLAELRDPDSAGRPLAETLADVRRFRAWVESRQKHSRRVILSEGNPADRTLEDPPASRRQVDPARAADRVLREEFRRWQLPEATDEPRPREHPLWDNWVDG